MKMPKIKIELTRTQIYTMIRALYQYDTFLRENNITKDSKLIRKILSKIEGIDWLTEGIKNEKI